MRFEGSKGYNGSACSILSAVCLLAAPFCKCSSEFELFSGCNQGAKFSYLQQRPRLLLRLTINEHMEKLRKMEEQSASVLDLLERSLAAASCQKQFGPSVKGFFGEKASRHDSGWIGRADTSERVGRKGEPKGAILTRASPAALETACCCFGLE